MPISNKRFLVFCCRKIKFLTGLLCFKIMLYFEKSVTEINLWKHCSWKTKSKLRKDSLSTVKENGSVMLI